MAAVAPAVAQDGAQYVATNWKKIWKKQLRPLADQRYHTKVQSDTKHSTKTETYSKTEADAKYAPYPSLIRGAYFVSGEGTGSALASHGSNRGICNAGGSCALAANAFGANIYAQASGADLFQVFGSWAARPSTLAVNPGRQPWPSTLAVNPPALTAGGNVQEPVIGSGAAR